MIKNVLDGFGFPAAVTHVRRSRTPALAITFLLTFMAPASARPPTAFWHSQPVAPNETVAIQGDGFTAATRVDIQRLDDNDPATPGTPLPRLTRPTTLVPQPVNSSTNLYALIPSNWNNGVFAYQLRDAQTSAVKLINAPDVWFAQGDLGSRASTGGWLRVFGNSLHIKGGTARLAFVHKGAGVRVVNANSGGNPYAQSFAVPADLPAGDYEIYLHNGKGGPAAWSKYQGFDDDPISSFKVVAANSGADVWTVDAGTVAHTVPVNCTPRAASCDAGFDAAIAKIGMFRKADGVTPSGGTLLVNAGTYRLTKPLVLPDHTILKGAGMKSTKLHWDTVFSEVNPDNSNYALVVGRKLSQSPYLRGAFGVSDVTLERTFGLGSQTTAQRGVCIEPAYTGNNPVQFAYIRRVWCKTPNTAADSTKAHPNGDYLLQAGVWMRGTMNAEITDSVFDHIVGVSLNGQNSRNNYLRIEGNTFRWRIAPIVALKGLHNLIYSGNTEEMQGNETENGTAPDADIGDFFGSFNHNQRDIYFAGNHLSRQKYPYPTNCKHTDPNKTYPVCPELGITLDGNDGAYFGKVASVQGTMLNLLNATSGPRPGSPKEGVQRGAIVQIMGGRGAGQWRHLMSPVLDETGATGVMRIKVDRPWELEPDSTSWLGINDFQGRMIFYRNDFSAAPKLQTYFATHDVLIANNLIGTDAVPASVPLWVGWHYSGLVRGWHSQILDNVISKAGASMSVVLSPYEHDVRKQGVYPAGFQDTLPSLPVYRNNRKTGNGVFQISLAQQNDGFLLEKNTGLESMRHIVPIATQNTGVLRRNRSIDIEGRKKNPAQ